MVVIRLESKRHAGSQKMMVSSNLINVPRMESRLRRSSADEAVKFIVSGAQFYLCVCCFVQVSTLIAYSL